MVASPERQTLQKRNTAIPPELKDLHQWARWIKGSRDKMPANLDNTAMKWGTRTNWLTFDQVSRFDKIGYFHTLESGIIGVDFDGCRNKETGEIHPLVLSWIKDTFAEVSPNEEGVKAYFRGKLPNDKVVKNTNVPWGDPSSHTGIEMYCEGRFFTVTGNIIPGCPSEINEAPEVLNDMLVRFVSAPKIREKVTPEPTYGDWDIDRWVYQHLEVVEKLDDGYIIVCPWCAEHTTSGDTARIWTSPKYTFNCFHAHCSGREWSDVRLKHEPTAYDKRDAWSNTTDYSPGQDHSSNGNGHTSPKANQQPELETIIQRLAENEYGDGLLFAEVFNGKVCYDHSEKAWYLWNKHHWKKDATGKVKQMVSGHLGSIYLKARGDVNKQIAAVQAEIETLQKEKSDDEKLSKLKNKLGYLGGLMEELEKRARALRGANRMKNVLTFAMSEHNIGITGEIWDADRWLLAIQNGVIDLRTGQLRDGYPIDYIRSVSPTEWTGLNALCPRFERFLQEIFGDKPEDQRQDLIAFLQRLLGYSVTGLVSEHIFPIFYGEEGRNGKDTLFTLLKFVLSSAIANAVSNDVLLSADKGRAAGAATPHLADLQGKRIVWGSETKQGDKFNVSEVKKITGGGGIPARKNYGDQYTFDPTHTLFLMTNYRPHADAKDKAFWTRVCLIEFNLRFVDSPIEANERKADTNLPKELEAEASGILAWLVRGCLEYQEQGLNRPDIVKLATESYRASEDNIQQFIDECCLLGDSCHVGANDLYKAYSEWCEDSRISRINVIGGKAFGEDMSKRFDKKRAARGYIYKGIGLLPENDPSPKGTIHQTALDLSSKEQEQCRDNVVPTHHSKASLEAVSEHLKDSASVGCVGYIQEVSAQLVREDSSLLLYGNTIHTLHSSSCEDEIKQPVEPIEITVYGQEAPYTPANDPTLDATIPDDFTYEAVECTECACGLARHLDGNQVCVRCYPPKGYFAYSHLVDEMYPRKQHKVEFGKLPQEEGSIA